MVQFTLPLLESEAANSGNFKYIHYVRRSCCLITSEDSE